MYPIIKRILDIIISLTGFIILSPIFLLIIIIVKLDSKGPVLFRQKRVGKGKKHFFILKFRTMTYDAPNDLPSHCMVNSDSYITKAGSFLRKYSLDELPQLLNIITGDMSIVGPRPALWNQYDLISHRDFYGANDLRPGLTGWAQINGRDELSIAQKAKLDGEYAKKISFGFDTKCFFMTFGKVLRREGIAEPGLSKQETINY